MCLQKMLPKELAEAIKIQPFAIILDLMLPNKDGWTTLKELKENSSTKIFRLF
jgi:DNA-binding response OmpR family regulator